MADCNCGNMCFGIPLVKMNCAEETQGSEGHGYIPDIRSDRETRLNYKREGRWVYSQIIKIPTNYTQMKWHSITHGIEDIHWIALDPTNSAIYFGDTSMPLPYASRAANNNIEVALDLVSVSIHVSNGFAPPRAIDFCVTYTKTTDEADA